MGARASARILVGDQRLRAGLAAALAMEGYTVQPSLFDGPAGADADDDAPDLLVIDLRSARAQLELVRHLPQGTNDLDFSEVPYPCSRIEVGDLVLEPATHLATRRNHHLNLTVTEFGILALLARQPGAVISKTALLTELRGAAEQSVNVVEVHVSSLRRKLEARGPRIIHTVRGVGYALRPLSEAG